MAAGYPVAPQDLERVDAPIENDPKVLGMLLNEVFLDTSQIELHNRGTEPLDLSGFWLCHTTPGLLYSRLPENTVIEPQGFLVLHWGIAGTNTETEIFTFPTVPLPLNRGDGEIAVFANFGEEQSNFDKSENIRDYMQWGTGEHFRERVAVEAGIWRAEGSVPLPVPGRSLAFVGRSDMPEGWLPSIPSMGATNVTP